MAPTQAALYAEIADDLQLSWSEAELPERERTKHVHRLHPYLGKFVPQLVEALLGRYVRPGGRVLDPFAGSGTTLVQALESGYDAVGVDVAAFNCLLMRVKTARYDPFLLEKELRDALSSAGDARVRGRGATYGDWYAPRGRRRSSCTSGVARDDYEHADVLRVVLARAARSARLTAHFDLDFPRVPRSGSRTGATSTAGPAGRSRRRTSSSSRYLDRHARAAEGVPAGAGPGARPRRSCTATRASSSSTGRSTASSPPRRIPGLIDYHEQHRYAYELLGLDDRRERELGAAGRGTSRAAIEEYVGGISDVLRGAPSC